MLTIGACNVDDPGQVFSCELKPISTNVDPEALAVTGLSLETLALEGLSPENAMRMFQDWVANIAGVDGVPVFVGLNAPFDWSFINHYFHYFLKSNSAAAPHRTPQSPWLAPFQCLRACPSAR